MSENKMLTCGALKHFTVAFITTSYPKRGSLSISFFVKNDTFDNHQKFFLTFRVSSAKETNSSVVLQSSNRHSAIKNRLKGRVSK
jgi:hypothetical protein